ncbi:T9SS type B sorting domain-containing protein [Taibaiella koreensis]|uniref:T9SS type B sorting domain-containing protein n=1 Tax=Taibaiella koreensis TaxID=1268548 RepID=UPI000E5995ED|nr:gliding motility-associated C-terminal domain-containing protein [Taibaiella koreensis]
MKQLRSFALLSGLFFLCLGLKARAQLVVNEFSNGASGNKEYVELLVKGQATCNDTCFDLRGWIFDDNNGWYGSTAVSPGCYRFASDANWSCVPYGSLIVIYNSGDLNPSMPADDPTDANNDGVYILPVSSPLLELNLTVPSTSSMNYPSTGFGPSTTWTNIALNNTNDAVQTVDPANLTAAYHAVSYGSGVVAPVHIAGSGAQKVFYLTNDQYNLSAGWTSGAVPTNETPGLPNTAANATWINSMKAPAGGTSSNDTLDVSICQGESYPLGSNLYTTAGYHTEHFTSQGGCDSIVTIDLTVNPIPAAPAVVSPVSYCNDGVAVPLSATGTHLTWYDTLVGGTGSATIPVPSTADTGNFYWYVSETVNGCESPRSEITVRINPLPDMPAADTSILLCQNAPAYTLSATGPNLIWYPTATGGVPSATAPVINTATAGIVHWYVTATANGCESRRRHIRVTVSAIDAVFTLQKDTLCITDPLVTLNTSAGDSLDYLWNTGDEYTSNARNIEHLYRGPGIFSVKLKITNSDGCRDSSSQMVWVSPVAAVDLSLDKHDICTGDEVLFTMKYTGGFGIMHWDFGDNNRETLNDRENDNRNREEVREMTHAYEKEGTYFFTLNTTTPGCPEGIVLDSVNVHPMPKVSLGNDSSMCLHGNAIYLANKEPAEAHARYEWSTGETTPAIEVKHHGDIKLTVFTDFCSNSDQVHIAKDCYIDIPNAFTPNGDGANDYFFPRQLLSSSVSLFKMQVLNRWGQVVFETTRPEGRGWDGYFNGTAQPGGVYIYLIQVAFRNGRSENYQGNVTLLR